MTDKQIIINGVDVSECSYYQYNMCTATKDDYGDCSLCCQDYDMNDCYYKQLKRKEQECEKLKAVLKAIANRPCLNINNCNGNCLPHCKWNAHKLAQEALKKLE